MATIVGTNRYSGKLNQKVIQGNGAISYNQENTQVIGVIDFSRSEFDDLQGASQCPTYSDWSIFCCWGCSDDDGSTIIDISQGDFTSQREVELYDGQKLVANILINGYAKSINGERYTIETEISGSYHGPGGFNNVDGYVLPLEPQENNLLVGSFTKELEGIDGKSYTVKQYHKFIFHDGVTKDLQSIEHHLTIDTEKSFVSNEKQFFYLVADSYIKNI